MKQEEKIKDLEERIALMDADNSALCADLEHWKKVAAGLKGRNKQLEKQLEHYKELDLEGDGLYEEKIAECEEKIAECEEKDKVISGLNSQVSKLNRCIESKDNEIKALSEKLETLQKQVSMPWWKKIFS